MTICDAAGKPIENRPLWDGTGADCLIVICSRLSAVDKRIDAEIKAFRNVCPGGKVIPYVIDGIPNAKLPQEECFPPMLRANETEEAFAVSEKELGRRHALLRLIATLFDIPLDTLTERALANKRRVMMTFLTAGAVVASFVLCWVIRDYLIWHQEYYSSYEYRYGVPCGVGRIYFPEWQNRKEYYIFSYASGHVTRVEPSPGISGFPEENPYLSAINTPVIMITYHTDCTVDTIVHMNEENQPLFYMNYLAGNTCADFSTDEAGLEPYTLVIDGAETDITRCVYTYDENGYLTEVKYLSDSRNTPSGIRSGDQFTHND